jgi:hypothetical protein
MADGITLSIDHDSQRKFDLALRNIATYFNKSINDLVMQLAIWTVVSARKLTPLSKQKRPARRSNAEEKKAWKGATHMMEWWNKDGTKEFLPIKDVNDEERIIKNRGAGRASWNGVLAKLGKSESIASGLQSLANRGSTVNENNSPQVAEINITNHLQYLLKLRPDIETASILLAEKRILGNYIKKAGDDAEQIWRNT